MTNEQIYILGFITFYFTKQWFDFVVPLVQMLQKMPRKLSLIDDLLMVLRKLQVWCLEFNSIENIPQLARLYVV